MKPELRRIGVESAGIARALVLEAYTPLLERYGDTEQSPASKTVERVAADIGRADTDAFLLMLNGAAIGYTRVVRRGESEYGLSDLCVALDMQGRGYAQQFIKELEGNYPSARKWSLVTVMEEARDCHLYEKLGYKRVGEPQRVNERMHLVRYAKDV